MQYNQLLFKNPKMPQIISQTQHRQAIRVYNHDLLEKKECMKDIILRLVRNQIQKITITFINLN